jgi:lysozyme
VKMAALDILLSLIKEFEGCKLEAYRCPAGVLTIGYGHTATVKPGQKISQQSADALLRQDANKALDEALHESPRLRNETPGRQAAVADFIYNCGIGNYRKSTFKRMIDAGDFGEAKHAVMMWVKATDPKTGKKVKLPGLVRRRQAEADLLLFS